MKIVVLDGYTENPGDLSWDGLKALGELKVYDRTPFNDNREIAKRIGDAEVVFTNKTPINKEIIDNCPNLKFISLLSTGYNVVDISYAKTKGIPVSNIPTYGTDSVSQFAIALLLEICHHIGHHNKAVHEGKWEHNPDWCFWDYPSIELENKTIGIVGLGRIGKITARVAQAFGMKILAVDSFHDDSAENDTLHYCDMDELLSNSDIIDLHCPLLPETENIINAAAIEKMKDGVMIINNSRGALIDEQALADALNSGKVYAAGLDTVREEPIKLDNPLLGAKNCFITPHISWTAVEGRQRLVDYSTENVKLFLEGKPKNIVNGD